MNDESFDARLRALLDEIAPAEPEGDADPVAARDDGATSDVSASKKRDDAVAIGNVDQDAVESICPICETRLFGAHCKLLCPNCGYREVCSDLF